MTTTVDGVPISRVPDDLLSEVLDEVSEDYERYGGKALADLIAALVLEMEARGFVQ